MYQLTGIINMEDGKLESVELQGTKTCIWAPSVSISFSYEPIHIKTSFSRVFNHHILGIFDEQTLIIDK